MILDLVLTPLDQRHHAQLCRLLNGLPLPKRQLQPALQHHSDTRYVRNVLPARVVLQVWFLHAHLLNTTRLGQQLVPLVLLAISWCRLRLPKLLVQLVCTQRQQQQPAL